MKKAKKIRLFTVLIALCMLVGTIPAYAVNPYGSLTLTFTSEEDIDLSGIEISINNNLYAPHVQSIPCFHHHNYK